MRIHAAAFATGLLLPLFCLAADDGELWEVTSQMNIPGMPAGMAGMGQAPQRVCTGKDPREDATKRPDMQKCKVVDLKQTATRMTLTMSCPEGQAVFDQTYNAARTEYKGTMTMKSRDGDMVMNMSGRKVGTCDVQQAKKAQDDKSAKLKSDMDTQIAAGQRQQAAAQRKNAADVSKSCTEAAADMRLDKFPMCYQPAGSKSADCADKQVFNVMVPPEAKTVCDAKKAEYCQKLQTEAGYLLAARERQGIEGGSALCGLQRAKLTSTLCASGLKSENYPFLGRFCPAEAKPLFAKHCAGRDYTSLQDKKMRNMCTTLARVDNKDGDDERPASSSAPAPKAAAETKKPGATEQVQQGVGKGLDKLRGLFGR